MFFFKGNFKKNSVNNLKSYKDYKTILESTKVCTPSNSFDELQKNLKLHGKDLAFL